MAEYAFDAGARPLRDEGIGYTALLAPRAALRSISTTRSASDS